MFLHLQFLVVTFYFYMAFGLKSYMKTGDCYLSLKLLALQLFIVLVMRSMSCYVLHNILNLSLLPLYAVRELTVLSNVTRFQ